ncbi:formyl transferase [Chryseobacterium foetidum]|uniref:formyl transferase n=1 Tax=Chryseobacterium foetidum TaxID=2951057 RepID=UPI0021C58B4D|nr:formyl transferase [Chryseobacterium foetidum]
MESKKIVLLAGKGISTSIVFNSIHQNFGVETAIIEEPENRKIFLRRRLKKLGFARVLGQVLFQILISKPLSVLSKKRHQEIICQFKLDPSEIPADKVVNVISVNSKTTIDLLKQINPDLIIVNGTRIISKKVLSSVNCKFINTHAGITPKYRGVHGTYWALVNSDLENSGVTVHFVDEGIDTGNIIAQSQVLPTENDNFSSYPLLQLGEGLKILNTAVQDFTEDRLIAKKEKKLKSFLWYHPTLWQYLYFRLRKGVK